MTANLIKGKSFRGALKYNLDKVDKNVAEVLDHSFVKVAEKLILKEVQMVKMLRPYLKRYFYHTFINFPYNENLNNELMKQIGLEYLKASGFNQHQYIMFRHYDADHLHLHILVNRIGYDGQVMSDSNDYASTSLRMICIVIFCDGMLVRFIISSSFFVIERLELIGNFPQKC